MYKLIECDHITCIVQNNLFTLLLSLSLIAGGSSITANAVNIQQDYIDVLDCDDTVNDEIREECDHLERLRDSQAGAAVRFLKP